MSKKKSFLLQFQNEDPRLILVCVYVCVFVRVHGRVEGLWLGAHSMCVYMSVKT